MIFSLPAVRMLLWLSWLLDLPPTIVNQLRFDVPAAGVYLIRIGNTPARKVVVIR